MRKDTGLSNNKQLAISYTKQLEATVKLRTVELEQRNNELIAANMNLAKVVKELSEANGKLENSNQLLINEINARRLIEDMLAESENKFRSFIEQSSEGIMVLDTNAKIIEWNKYLGEIYGVSGDKYLGMYMYDFDYLFLPQNCKTPTQYSKIKTQIESYILNIDNAKTYNYEQYSNTFLGELKYLHITVFPIITVKAKFIGRIIRDLTHKKQQDDKILNYQLHLEELVRKKTSEALDKQRNLLSMQKKTDNKLKQHKEIIQFVQDSITLTLGDKFFETIVENISRSLHANYTFVADLLPSNKYITTKAFYSNGSIIPNQTIELINSPCLEVLKKGYYSISTGTLKKYASTIIQNLNVNAYFGKILLNSQQKPVGILVTMYTQRAPDEELTKQILEIFSSRIGFELERQIAEKALIESEHKLLNIFHNSSDGILITDYNQSFIEANATIEKISGYQKYELLKLKTKDLVLPAYWKTLDKRQLMLKRSGMAPSVEIEIMNKDGKVVLVEINSKIIEDNGVQVILTLVRDISDRKQMEKRLFETILATEEKEREKFAGNLHDELGPLLSSLKMYISLFVESNDVTKKNYILEQIQTLIKESITTVREISNDLSPHVLNNYGLATAINSFVSLKKEWVIISFTNTIGTKRYGSNLEVMAYRIVKELINNTIKHAKATNIDMKLTETNKALYLFYKDNGIGFDPNQVIGKKQGSIGLMNMLRRIKSINGRYKFASSKGEGVAFELLIPLE